MKFFLTMLFFLGLTTTGFAQWSVTVSGSLSVVSSSEYNVVFNCGGEGTCFKLSGADNGGVRVEVPSLEIDEVIGGVQVNGVPAEALPLVIPGNGEDYHLEMFPFEEIY